MHLVGLVGKFGPSKGLLGSMSDICRNMPTNRALGVKASNTRCRYGSKLK